MANEKKVKLVVDYTKPPVDENVVKVYGYTDGEGGGGGDYNDLDNKPQIEGQPIEGNMFISPRMIRMDESQPAYPANNLQKKLADMDNTIQALDDDIPFYSGADAGKVLTVIPDGSTAWRSPQGGNLPDMFESDIGNQLTVNKNADGDLEAIWGSPVGDLAIKKGAGLNSLILGEGSEATHTCGYAEGRLTKARGEASHAEGAGSQTTSAYAHAEGYYTKAWTSAHAEGQSTEANGAASHAEGKDTGANGADSHAEGWETIAAVNHQHVQGKYNVVDNAGAYADIVGWGTNEQRKNISSLTTSGDLHLAGKVYIQANNNGTGGIELGAGGSDLPEYTAEDKNKMLVVNSAGDGIEWAINSDIPTVDVDLTTKLKDLPKGLMLGRYMGQVLGYAWTFQAGVILSTGGDFKYCDYTKLDGTDCTMQDLYVQNHNQFSLIRNNQWNIQVNDDVLILKAYEGAQKYNRSASDGDAISFVGPVSATNQEIRSFEIDGRVYQPSEPFILKPDEVYNFVYVRGYLCRFTSFTMSDRLGKGTGTHSVIGGNLLTVQAQGNNSFAFGDGAKATGGVSAAFGTSTQASSDQSFATGLLTVASGENAFATGYKTLAEGHSAVAEGYGTKAIGAYSHAEGFGTIAASEQQHVQGIYNVEDNANWFADIIGGGYNDSNRTNLEATDWAGNKYIAGDIYVHCDGSSANGTRLDPPPERFVEKITKYGNQWLEIYNKGQTVPIQTMYIPAITDDTYENYALYVNSGRGISFRPGVYADSIFTNGTFSGAPERNLEDSINAICDELAGINALIGG